MNESQARDILSGRRRGWVWTLVRVALAPAGWAYGLIMRARRRFYRWGVLPSGHPGRPTICVGNLTTGGTGKTPMVARIVEWLAAAGHTPAVLTRGYRAAQGVSDEATLLGRRTGAAVIVEPDRLAGAARAIDDGADVLVCDDAFQHLRLKRDLDVVLIDAAEPFGFGHCLPRGLLREPVSAIRDAGAVVITRSDAVAPDELEALKERLIALAPSATVHAAVHRAVKVIDETGAGRPIDALAGRTVCAFCGIADPQRFFDTLGGLGARPVATRALNDHVAYTGDLLGLLREWASTCDADLLVTTQKDAVKLGTASLGKPVWQLVVEMDVIDGGELLRRKVVGAAVGRGEP